MRNRRWKQRKLSPFHLSYLPIAARMGDTGRSWAGTSSKNIPSLPLRRRFMINPKVSTIIAKKSLIIAAAVLAVVNASAHGETTKPNVVYILLDDAGYGDLSCYGQKKFSTPRIDTLAKQGLRFTQHYAGCTVCAPTRSVLMTGKHTGHTFIRGNKEVQPEGQYPLADDIVTVAELLSGAGYTTGAFGKWGLGNPGSKGDPIHQGFDVFFGYNCQRQAHTYYPTHLWDNGDRVALDGKTYAHDLIIDEALEFIRDNREQPFFCFLPVTIPHAAMHVPASYSAPFREKFSQFEQKIGKYRGPLVKNPIAAFAGMMTKMDEDVGRLLDLLNELGLEENTIVMLSSDNGPHREGGHDPVFFDSNGPLKGFKRDLFEGGIRAPFIVRWPGKTPANEECDLVSAHWDVLPTLCELAGAAVPNDVDGISLVPTLTGKPQSQKQHEYLYWEFYEQGGKRAARFGRWKAVQLNVHKTPDGPIKLYDLSNDLGEQHDLSATQQEQVTEAVRIFKHAHTPSDLWRFGK
ncbi:MAG: arylsulfatase [Pirellulaceae bacterium]